MSQDTIQLAHTAFTHFLAEQTPTFAVGTAATSATDYLFYNSGTGGLYYDTDARDRTPPIWLRPSTKG